MKQRIFLLTLLFLLILTRTNDISAKETKLNEDMFTNVENTLKDKEIDLSYTQLVKQLIHGNVKGVLHTIKAKMKEVFLNRMLIQKDLIREILLIAFTAAIFKNLSDSFFQQSTANSAFYITYVILCGVMVHSFFYLNKTVTQLVTLMADYMKGMIMAYSLAVVSTSGITTSTTVYEFYLLLIYAMTTLTNVVLLPMIKILFVLKIINHISKEEHFSRLCKTLEGVIKFLLKGFLSVLLGVQLIQSMILPAVDSMKNTVLQKGMSAIPGIGSGLNSAMTMVIGSAVVIKNSIGAVGILVLIVIIVPPVIEITAVVLTYLLAGIMIQPISDKRITGAMDAVIQSGKLMFSTFFSKPRFTKEKIYFDKNEMKIIFSCSDRNRTGLIFQTAFLSIQHMEFPLANGNHMILRKIIQKKEVLITEPVVYFQTMLGNGLCVREHNRETNRDIFITCEDKEFPEKAEMIIKNQLQMAGFYKKQYEDIKVEPVDCKKIVVKHYGIFIDLTVGVLKISGDMNALQYLYQSGAGSHHATGFGCLNVIRQGEDE